MISRWIWIWRGRLMDMIPRIATRVTIPNRNDLSMFIEL
jgi:hypothetical protein